MSRGRIYDQIAEKAAKLAAPILAIYTIVIRCKDEEDAHAWANVSLDPQIMTVRYISGSGFGGHMIVRVEADFTGDDYTGPAFEGSLNAEMRDPISDVVWWSKKEA